jgi:hypothetical protein
MLVVSSYRQWADNDGTKLGGISWRGFLTAMPLFSRLGGCNLPSANRDALRVFLASLALLAGLPPRIAPKTGKLVRSSYRQWADNDGTKLGHCNTCSGASMTAEASEKATDPPHCLHTAHLHNPPHFQDFTPWRIFCTAAKP